MELELSLGLRNNVMFSGFTDFFSLASVDFIFVFEFHLLRPHSQLPTPMTASLSKYYDYVIKFQLKGLTFI